VEVTRPAEATRLSNDQQSSVLRRINDTASRLEDFGRSPDRRPSLTARPLVYVPCPRDAAQAVASMQQEIRST
jgi:hypothetical protein